MKNKGYVEIAFKALEPDNNNEYVDIEGMATVPTIDRDEEIVNPLGLELENFEKNPIILFNHDKNIPVGKALEVKATKSGVYVKCRIFKNMNEKVYNGVINGILNSFSIGFLGKEGTYDPETDAFIYTKAELFEISIVSVPANPNAQFTMTKAICNGGTCALKAISENIKISDKISEKPWSDVDKTVLANKLKEIGDKKAIDEAYLYVGDYEKITTWCCPHHELSGNELILNKNGVIAAYQALKGAHGNKPNIPDEAYNKALEHIKKHYLELYKKGYINNLPDEFKNKEMDAMDLQAQIEALQKEIEELKACQRKPKDDEKKKEAMNYGKIVDENQNANEGDQLVGGDEGELVVNVTPNSVLTAYPNPPKGYRIRRYLKDQNVMFEFVIGKSEVAKLLAFMNKYFKDRDDNGNQKQVIGLGEAKEVLSEMLDKASEKELDELIKLHEELGAKLNDKLNQILGQGE